LRGPTERGAHGGEAARARLWIRLPNWLGDALLARPVLTALARSRGADSIRAAAPQPILDLLAGDGSFGSHDAWPHDGMARAASLVRVRAWKPDVALVLPPSLSSAAEAWQSGAGVRIGYAGEGRSAFLSRALPRPARGARHLADEYLDLGAALGGTLDVARAAPPLPVAPESRAAAGELLRSHSLGDAPLALLGPGAIYGPAKRWGADRFASLGTRLAARGFAVAVCGTAAEREVCEAVARGVGGARVASLAGATSLAALAGIAALASVAVCNDSGLAHLAAAVGAPTVVIFGSTSSAWTAPLGARVRVVQHAPVCSPCFQRTCRIGTLCLEAVSVDEVESACAEAAA